MTQTRQTPDQPPRVHLRIMGLSDLHMNIDGYDYFRDKVGRIGGLAQLAPVIEAARAEQPNAVLFDNGDTLQGSPMGDTAVEEPECWPHGVHPIIAVLNDLGVDCATLGNHEFNYGLPFLRQAMAGRTFPIVSSNITLTGSQEPLFAPWVILERRFADEGGRHHDLKLGVFGVCPRQILKWDRHHLEGEVEVADLVEAAGLAMERLRQEGAISLSVSPILALLIERQPGVWKTPRKPLPRSSPPTL